MGYDDKVLKILAEAESQISQIKKHIPEYSDYWHIQNIMSSSRCRDWMGQYDISGAFFCKVCPLYISNIKTTNSTLRALQPGVCTNIADKIAASKTYLTEKLLEII